MFDIGFSEIVVIMVVALIVIGPERLPKVARTLGHLWGRAQRYVNGVRADIERDMQLDEVRQLRLKMEQEARSVEKEMNKTVQMLDQHVQAMDTPIDREQIVEIKPRSVPIPTADNKPKAAAPVQQQFPID